MSEIYTPPNCHPLSSDKSIPQIRLGIQGFPGVGKTWAALTFPNPIILNLDRGIGAHQGRSDVIEIPFYQFSFSGAKHELKDKLIFWLESEGMRLTPNQTLVVDSLSSLEIYYHLWFKANELKVALGKSGKVNDFAEWNIKETYFNELGNLFGRLRCNVVLLTHESEKADKPTAIGQPGVYTGKIRPLMTGKVGDTIIKDYTDWFRAHSAAKPKDYTTLDKDKLALWGMKSAEEFKAMCDTFPDNTIFYWQCRGDDLFNAKAGSLVGVPTYIPANYQAFNKYKRNKTV